MRKPVSTLLFFFMLYSGISQVAPDKYFVEFTDKHNSPYSIDHPEDFLSPRAIERRELASIPVDETDIPVNPDYVETIAEIDVQVLTRSKWFNGITIFTTSPAHIESIELLPFVKSVTKNQKLIRKSHQADFQVDEVNVNLKQWDSSYYGLSYTQSRMVGVPSMHNLGFRGEGVVIAVLDAGFLKADELPAFDSLWANNQILGTRDFVEPGGNVFIGHNHGMAVLSVMGGNLPGQLVGTAPKADYWLLRSEDTGSEYLVEEYNWVSAAEFADSAGADIINSSLGYTVFNDSTQNHSCSDMTGNFTPVTRGANMAFSKGILVVNSAGNEGGNPDWRCVSAPADGTDVLAVGAVDSLGHYASFSSVGTVEGSYVKPNVSAMGRLTVIQALDGTITRSNGTSFSSPVMAGAAACLWQAFPHYSNATIKRAIEESGSQFTSPDIYLGYGIPNIHQAYERLTGISSLSGGKSFTLFPNPISRTQFSFPELISPQSATADITLISLDGQVIWTWNALMLNAGINTLSIPSNTVLNPGIYILRINSSLNDGFTECHRIQVVP